MGSVTFGRRPSRWRAGVVPLVALFSVAVACSSGAESESRVVGSSAGVGAQPSGTKAAASAVARGPEELAAAGYDGGPGAVFVGVSGPAGRSFAAAGLDGDDAAVTPDMAWEGASLSKMVVAASVLQLVDRGDVDLDEPISSYVDFDVADTITVRDVMMHRSGIADMTAQLESCPSESTLDAMRSHAGAATGPGEVDYSNTNFILLGDMVGQLTGHDIGAYAAEHIFEPLQMTDTYWWESQDGPSPYWRMPSSDPGDVSPFSCAALDQTVGTEGLTFVTSLDDMDRFLRGLFDGDVISPATFDEMLPRGGEPGLGLWSETSDETGVTLVGHFGSRRDFSAVAYFEPNDQRSVIVFADTGVDVEELMWEAADWAEANDL